MKRVVVTLSLLLGLTVLGTVGFHIVVGLNWLESLYQAVITLSTVGSRDVAVDDGDRVFVILYLMLGLGIFTFSAFSFGSWIVSAEFRVLWEKRQMQRRINQLEGHSIICGQGRTGYTICEYLAERDRPFVVIDHNEERVTQRCQEHGWPFLVGDATDDDALREAGIERATSLTTVLATDADNLYVVLSARMLNAKLQIIARAVDEKAIEKLERAGATRVVSPFRSGAMKMARFMLNPSIEDFIEIADTRGNNLELADVQVLPDSPYVGLRLMDIDLRSRGIMVIGIRRKDGERLMPPPGDAVLMAEDSLFVFGSADAVNSVVDGSYGSGMG